MPHVSLLLGDMGIGAERHDPHMWRLRIGRQIDIGHAEDHPLAVGRNLRIADALQLHHVVESERMLSLGKSGNCERKNKKGQKNTAHEVPPAANG
jgi:hypothetical protein